MKDYQREELKAQAEQAKQNLKSDCPLLEDEVAVAAWEYIQELENYRTPREWIGLTDDEVEEAFSFPFHYRSFYKAVEAKLKEKNGG